MYLYVVVQETDKYYTSGPDSRCKARLEKASGERCLVVPYQEFNLGTVNELKPRAIVMSGFGGHFQSRRVEWFHGMDEVLHGADLPMLCFCGSHQLLAYAFSRNLKRTKLLRDQPIRKLGLAEDLPRQAQGDPRYDLSAYYVADGFFPIKRLMNDPLFRGLPRIMLMRCSHYCEVKTLPPDFELLAESGHCRIEAMRHKQRPVYGTQFHPEAYEAPFFHGRTLLENFAGIVNNFWNR